MSDTDWLTNILIEFDTWCLCGNKECGLSENYKEAEQAILRHINKAIGTNQPIMSGGTIVSLQKEARNQLRAELRQQLGIKEGE
jgi:hypothetical protein